MPRSRRASRSSTAPGATGAAASLDEVRRRMDEHYSAAIKEKGGHHSGSVGNPHSMHMGHAHIPIGGGYMPHAGTPYPGAGMPPAGSAPGMAAGMMGLAARGAGETASSESTLENLVKLGINLAGTALSLGTSVMGGLMPCDDDGCSSHCDCHYDCGCGCDDHGHECCSQFGHACSCTPSVGSCG